MFLPPSERQIIPPALIAPTLTLKMDFALQDAQNRKLGEMGEEWIVNVERKRLLEHGRDDLAKRVEWVSSTRGDGLGYDVVSFNHEDDSERHVEVKTTTLGKFFPFYVSANEVRVSEKDLRAYHLYRVFAFGRVPQVFVLKGALSQTCQLQATQYLASV